MKRFAVSCVMTNRNKEGTFNIINMIDIVEAENHYEAIGKFTTGAMKQNPKHSLFLKPLTLEIENEKSQEGE